MISFIIHMYEYYIFYLDHATYHIRSCTCKRGNFKFPHSISFLTREHLSKLFNFLSYFNFKSELYRFIKLQPNSPFNTNYSLVFYMFQPNPSALKLLFVKEKRSVKSETIVNNIDWIGPYTRSSRMTAPGWLFTCSCHFLICWVVVWRYELCFNGEKIIKASQLSQVHEGENEKNQNHTSNSTNGERTDSENTVVDVFRWSRCKKPLPQKVTRSLGIPLPLEHVEVLHIALFC